MKCPHRLEPHQIQGLDFIHIFPVIQVRACEHIIIIFFTFNPNSNARSLNSHVPQAPSGTIKNSWWILWCWAGQALQQLNISKPWNLHHHASQWEWGSCAQMLSLSFWLIGPKHMFPEVLVFLSRCSLANFSLALMLIFNSKGFFLASSYANKSFAVFLVADACTLTSTVARATCRSHDDISGFSETSWSFLRSALGLRRPDLGMLTVVLNVFHL